MNNKSDANKSLTNKEPFTPAIYLYLGGIIFSIIYFYWLYTISHEQKYILLFIGSLTILILYLNGYFSYKDSLESFDIELNQYSYVETNARILVTSALAIAFFFQYKGFDKINMPENIKKSIEYPVIISFIFSCLILTIVWMPKHSGLYIRVLREIKTVFLTLAISSLIISMTTTIFVH